VAFPKQCETPCSAESFRIHWGTALTELECYAEAEQQVLNCEPYMSEPKHKSGRWGRAWLDGLAKLYTDWHIAETDAGHDAKAAEWRVKAAAEKTPVE